MPILPKVRDPRFITVRRGGTLSDSDHRSLAEWALECAEHVLPRFEAAQPTDRRPHEAMAIARGWIRGEVPMKEAHRAAFRANAAAKGLPEAAKLAALAVGQAVAVAHVAAHELGAAAYAIRSASSGLAPGEAARAAAEERSWQRSRLPREIRALVLDDQRLRNALCWGVFGE